MLIEALGRHFAVASRQEAEKMVATDAGFWNVISLHGPGQSRAALHQAKCVLYLPFDDIEQESFRDQGFRPVAVSDWTKMIEFHDRTKADPLLVHCIMGMSRSAGVALVLIYRVLRGRANAATLALDILMQVRPIACPNELVVRRGLETFLAAEEVEALIRFWARDKRLLSNAIRR